MFGQPMKFWTVGDLTDNAYLVAEFIIATAYHPERAADADLELLRLTLKELARRAPLAATETVKRLTVRASNGGHAHDCPICEGTTAPTEVEDYNTIPYLKRALLHASR